jgi:hypothetical protein
MPSQQGLFTMLFCLQFLASEPASAGSIFEWKDKNGAMHFSDHAPVGLPFTEKATRPASSATGPVNETGIRKAERILLENVRRQRLEIERARQALAQQYEQRQFQCSQERTRYHEMIHRPGSAGSGDFRIQRRKMNESCD